jgi:hypothetical protein
MVQVIILIAFFVVLAGGAFAATLAGRLPTAKQLAEEDARRFAQYRRELRA